MHEGTVSTDFSKCVRHLQKMGYAINLVQPVDTAPHTKELLVIVWMSRGLRLARGLRDKIGLSTTKRLDLESGRAVDADVERLLTAGRSGGLLTQ